MLLISNNFLSLYVIQMMSNVWYIDAQSALSQTNYCKIFCFILLEMLIMIQLNFPNEQLLIHPALLTITETANEYVNIVIEQLNILIVHCYISKCQSSYLKKFWDWISEISEIDSSTVLFLGDFVEIYQFVIQVEVQGFQGNNSQCTLDSVVTYYQENDELKSISYCVISDDRKHDVALVYEI